MLIINPWLFYLADISDTIKEAITVCGSVILVVFTIVTFIFFMEGDIEVIKRAYKYAIIGGVMVFIGLFFPKEETCYKMMAASLVTTENIQAMGETATNVVDYIVDSIDQLLEEDEESK